MKMHEFVTAAVVAAGLFGSAPPAEAKQCVWNKAGFVLQVDWYRNGDVQFDTVSRQPKLRENARPIQTNSYTLGTGGCQRSSEQMWAVLSIRGASWVKKGLSIGAVTATAIGTGVAGAVVCAGTAGAGCAPAAAGVGAAVGGASQVAAEFIPDPVGLDGKPGVFAIEVPSDTTWMYVKGTVWNPSIFDGAKIKPNE